MEEFIWRVWNQELNWYGRHGKLTISAKNQKTLKKIYDICFIQKLDPEHYIRGQFYMKQNHNFTTPGPLQFSHLVGDGCVEIAKEFIKLRPDLVKTKLEAITKCINDYGDLLIDDPKNIAYFTVTGGPVAEFLINAMRYDVNRLDIDDFRLIVTNAAIECVRYPELLELEFIQKYKDEDFQLLFIEQSKYRQQLNP